MKKVALLPAYNLEGSISDIVKRTKVFMDEVIVVSDGSSDDTNGKAKEAGAICPPHTMTRGKGFAMRKGIEECKKLEPDIIVFIDADGQHLPEEIPVLIKPIIDEDVDMVVGSRMMGKLRTSFINKIGNFILKVISLAVTFKWLTDTESGFRAFKAQKLYDLKLESIGYEIESELLLRALNCDLKIAEVPITVPKAVPGVTVLDGIKMGIYKIRLGLKLRFER